MMTYKTATTVSTAAAKTSRPQSVQKRMLHSKNARAVLPFLMTHILIQP